MNFLCPACKTPLPVATPVVIACSQCGVEVDLTRVDTAPGQARLWPEVDLTGETLGTFKLTSRAGSGGMGTVYVAEGLTGRCAVKVLSAQMAADPGLRERFRREAHALRQVQHPGVVHIIDEGAQNGFCWYAMEHVEGKDLRARLAEGPLPAAEVDGLARQLLDALAAVHDAQLVHRDLKPGNILLSATGARLCDFGIARFDGATTLTESAALLGSLRYMAPEQRAGVTTPKSDLYSLGLVLHEALTGGLPGEKELPGGRVARLIETLLQPSPSKRPADARAAAKLIAPRSRRALGTAALVASSVLGVGAFAGWAALASRIGPPPPAPVKKEITVAAAPMAEVPDAGALAVTRVPRVRPDPPQVSGFDARLISKLTLEHQAELQSCYEQGLAGAPGLSGKIAVQVAFRAPPAVKGRIAALVRPAVVGASGKKPSAKEELLEAPPTKAPPPKPAPPRPLAMRVFLASSTLANANVEECVLASVRGWQFPPPPNAKAGALLSWSFDEATPDELAAEPVDLPPVKEVPTKVLSTRRPTDELATGTSAPPSKKKKRSKVAEPPPPLEAADAPPTPEKTEPPGK